MYTHLDYTVRSRQKQKKLPLRLNKKGLYRQNFSINERNLIPKKRKTAIKQPPLKRHFPLDVYLPRRYVIDNRRMS